MQVALVYLEWFRRNSLLKCVLQPKIAKKFTKTPYFGVQGRSRSSMLAQLESSLAVLVMISSKSVSICNHCRARLVDSSRNRMFSRGQIWCARTEDSVNLGGQTLHRWNLCLIPNISYAGCPSLSWMVSAQFILKICIAAENGRKFAKTPIFGVQGRSRSSMLVPLESSSAVLAVIRSKSASICNRFHARWANSGKITIFKGGTPVWCPRSRGISLPSGTKLPHKKLETLVYHMVKTRSLYLT